MRFPRGRPHTESIKSAIGRIVSKRPAEATPMVTKLLEQKVTSALRARQETLSKRLFESLENEVSAFATEEDEESEPVTEEFNTGNKDIIAILTRIADKSSAAPITFMDKTNFIVDVTTANAILSFFRTLPAAKQAQMVAEMLQTREKFIAITKMAISST